MRLQSEEVKLPTQDIVLFKKKHKGHKKMVITDRRETRLKSKYDLQHNAGTQSQITTHRKHKT